MLHREMSLHTIHRTRQFSAMGDTADIKFTASAPGETVGTAASTLCDLPSCFETEPGRKRRRRDGVKFPTPSTESTGSNMLECRETPVSPFRTFAQTLPLRRATFGEAYHSIEKYPRGSAVRDAVCGSHPRDRTLGRVLYTISLHAADAEHALDLMGALAYDTSFLTRPVRERLVEKLEVGWKILEGEQDFKLFAQLGEFGEIADFARTQTAWGRLVGAISRVFCRGGGQA